MALFDRTSSEANDLSESISLFTNFTHTGGSNDFALVENFGDNTRTVYYIDVLFTDGTRLSDLLDSSDATLDDDATYSDLFTDDANGVLASNLNIINFSTVDYKSIAHMRMYETPEYANAYVKDDSQNIRWNINTVSRDTTTTVAMTGEVVDINTSYLSGWDEDAQRNFWYITPLDHVTRCNIHFASTRPHNFNLREVRLSTTEGAVESSTNKQKAGVIDFADVWLNYGETQPGDPNEWECIGQFDNQSTFVFGDFDAKIPLEGVDPLVDMEIGYLNDSIYMSGIMLESLGTGTKNPPVQMKLYNLDGTADGVYVGISTINNQTFSNSNPADPGDIVPTRSWGGKTIDASTPDGNDALGDYWLIGDPFLPLTPPKVIIETTDTVESTDNLEGSKIRLREQSETTEFVDVATLEYGDIRGRPDDLGLAETTLYNGVFSKLSEDTLNINAVGTTPGLLAVNDGLWQSGVTYEGASPYATEIEIRPTRLDGRRSGIYTNEHWVFHEAVLLKRDLTPVDYSNCETFIREYDNDNNYTEQVNSTSSNNLWDADLSIHERWPLGTAFGIRKTSGDFGDIRYIKVFMSVKEGVNINGIDDGTLTSWMDVTLTKEDNTTEIKTLDEGYFKGYTRLISPSQDITLDSRPKGGSHHILGNIPSYNQYRTGIVDTGSEILSYWTYDLETGSFIGMPVVDVMETDALYDINEYEVESNDRIRIGEFADPLPNMVADHSTIFEDVEYFTYDDLYGVDDTVRVAKEWFLRYINPDQHEVFGDVEMIENIQATVVNQDIYFPPSSSDLNYTDFQENENVGDVVLIESAEFYLGQVGVNDTFYLAPEYNHSFFYLNGEDTTLLGETMIGEPPPPVLVSTALSVLMNGTQDYNLIFGRTLSEILEGSETAEADLQQMSYFGDSILDLSESIDYNVSILRSLTDNVNLQEFMAAGITKLVELNDTMYVYVGFPRFNAEIVLELLDDSNVVVNPINHTDTVSMIEDAAASLILYRDALSTLILKEDLDFQAVKNASDVIDLNDDPAITVFKFLSLVDTLGVDSDQRWLISAIAEYLVITSAYEAQKQEVQGVSTESVDAVELLQWTRKLAAQLEDSMTISDGHTHSLSFILATEDSMLLSEDFTANAIMRSIIASDSLAFRAVMNDKDGYHTIYSFFPEVRAMTTYTNHDFTSYATVKEENFGVKFDGVYWLDGYSDDGQDITKSLKLPFLDFGTSNLKALDHVYVGYSTDDSQVYIKVTADNEMEVQYFLVGDENGIQTNKVDIGRGIVGRYWQLELTSIGTDRMDLDTIEFAPLIFRRKY